MKTLTTTLGNGEVLSFDIKPNPDVPLHHVYVNVSVFTAQQFLCDIQDRVIDKYETLSFDDAMAFEPQLYKHYNEIKSTLNLPKSDQITLQVKLWTGPFKSHESYTAFPVASEDGSVRANVLSVTVNH